MSGNDAGRSGRRRQRTSSSSHNDASPTRPRLGITVRFRRAGAADNADSENDIVQEVEPRDLLEELYDAQEEPDDVDDSDFDVGDAMDGADDSTDNSDLWVEMEDDEAAAQEQGGDGEDDDEEVMVASPGAVIRRVINSFMNARDGRRPSSGSGGSSGSRVQRPARLPQEPLDADVAWEVNRDTCADSLRSPSETASESPTPQRSNTPRIRSIAQLLRRREADCTGTGHFSRAQRAHVTAFRSLPMEPTDQIDSMASRVYTGRFSRSGDVFVAAFQHERKVRIYEANHDWRLRKDVLARNLRWTVTDTDISPSEQFLIYSSITPEVHLVNLAAGGVASEANVTDIHEVLHFDSGGGDDSDDDPFHSGGFGIWAVRWSGDGREVLAGAGDGSLYVYDIAEGKVSLRIHGHRDDVNAIAWADDSANLLISGSDDRMVKVWDRRTPQAATGIAAANFVGHLEGVTHIDPKGDGRHFISNGKDQTVKLWDMRKCHSAADMAAGKYRPVGLPRFQWDYRWMAYPGQRRDLVHPHDCSIMTYKGHAVLQTLIRAYFSPAATTGQRFIYAGSADGTVYVWDLVTGAVEHKLEYHDEIVRDCSWHPTQPTIVTTSFDGTVVRWDTKRVDEDADERRRQRRVPKRPGGDQLA